MSFIDENPGYEIVTEEQAKNWLLEYLCALETVRGGCNFVVPGDKLQTAEFQKSAYRKFIAKQGGVLGMLAVLCKAKKLSRDAYGLFKSQAMALLGPSLIIGRYDWFSRIEDDGLTSEQARSWALEQLALLEEARSDCNVYFPKDAAKTARFQQDAEMRFLVKHGCVLGMLVAMHRCRLLGDVAYDEIRTKAMALSIPTLVGETHHGR
jgi:hypothetical protein